MGLLDKVLGKAEKIAKDEWRYVGGKGYIIDPITFKGHGQTLKAYVMKGAGNHSGFVVHVEGRGIDANRRSLSNGFIRSKRRALIVADRYMSGYSGAVFIQDGPQTLRQDEWLDAHERDYEFQVVPESLL